MRHASLFSGIGGFDLAAQWMGWDNVFQVEIDEFCQKVLAKNFPNTKRYGDIKQFDGTEWAGKIDILTGGFPCQPYSSAGKRLGKEDERHLWPEMLRVIEEVQPSFVLGENVYGLLNWSRGLVFEEVQVDLENIGYEVTSVILPACSKGAPHRRDRIWFVAYRNGKYSTLPIQQRRQGSTDYTNLCRTGTKWASANTTGIGCKQQDRCHYRCERGVIPKWICTWSESLRRGKIAANSSREGLQRCKINGEFISIWKNGKKQPARLFPSEWHEFPTQSPVCRRDDGVSNRVDRIKSLGNAIVPQVAFEIFKAIESTLPNQE